ncbi:MAG: hypothetical protein M3O28_11655 [Actinomycetota bacterium]|nr:hypothetical protein [Actinomycetota bacterium]MDP9167742.1 hypothetical protein [Actinomycetota bacterium]
MSALDKARADRLGGHVADLLTQIDYMADQIGQLTEENGRLRAALEAATVDQPDQPPAV